MTGEFAVGVHALVFLNHKKTVVSSEMVAENVCTNPARVRKILASLKKAGLVSTKEGLDGGYQFSADASKVNLCMIADALGVAFVSSSWKSGNLEKNCLIASGIGRAAGRPVSAAGSEMPGRAEAYNDCRFRRTDF